ncbi:1-acyl-sn-glycerol-3-phosphate-acyltransferase [Mycena pura]|uniref:1-acyl-sn-glycerol-3-phosphate-acyltransferase n=1 Tax=Mycena pura TaxID=153505 RepID=A0AAD6VRX9_9AGAR|nr:1-acyl-sn-glycerol-3-phosphate-acyltransferase [Mycena pura]
MAGSQSLACIRYCVRMGVYLAVMAFWGIAMIPVFLAYSIVGRRFEAGQTAARSYSHLIGWLLRLHLELEGAEHLAKEPAVLPMNHQSVLDVWLLGLIAPARISIMVKKSLRYTPIGPCLYLSGCVHVQRGTGAGAMASMRAAGVTLRKSRSTLLAFPEGTRNGARSPTLLPFKKGAFHMAVQNGLPIVPIVCENYAHMYQRGYFEPVPLRTRGLGPEDVSDLTVRVHAQMLQALREISRPIQAYK